MRNKVINALSCALVAMTAQFASAANGVACSSESAKLVLEVDGGGKMVYSYKSESCKTDGLGEGRGLTGLEEDINNGIFKDMFCAYVGYIASEGEEINKILYMHSADFTDRFYKIGVEDTFKAVDIVEESLLEGGSIFSLNCRG